MSLGFEAVPAQAEALLSASGDVKDVAEIKGLLAQLPKSADPKALLAKAGVPNASELIAQAGLPPEAGAALVAAGAIFKAKGLGGKISATTDLAQKFLDQQQGPILGTVSGKLSGFLQKHLGIDNLGGKAGGAGGTAIGTALFGPIGGSIGHVVGGLFGGTIGKLVPGAKASRENREKNREADDMKRLQRFKYKKPEDIYHAFRAGKVYWNVGVPGTDKWNEKKEFVIRDGQVTDVTAAAMTGKIGSKQSGPDVLYLDSNKVAQATLASMFNVEQKILKAAQEKARAARQQLKQGLATAVRQQPVATPRAAAPARQRPRAAPAVPAQPPAAQRRGYVYKRPKAAAPQAATPAQQQQISTPSYEELVRSIFGAGTP